jgi:hypothetical protein
MAASPERETISPAPEGVVERPTEIPPDVERVTGVRRKPSDFTAQVTDDNGKQLIKSPATQTVTVKLPATQDKLSEWAKGSASDALTWFANFWLRIIKKAAHFGWKVVTRGKKS